MTPEIAYLFRAARAGMCVIATPCIDADGVPTLGVLTATVDPEIFDSALHHDDAMRAAFLLGVTREFRARVSEQGLTPA